VSNLEKERFDVYDRGRRQDIALFSGEDAPVTVGLVIDASRSMTPKIGEVVAAALAFARSSNPQDELFAVAFNDRVSHAIGEEPLAASDLPRLETALRSVRTEGRTALYDALAVALDRMASAARARKVLIVLSDGGDNASRSTLDDALARARRSNVTIYTIGLFDRDDLDTNPGVLKSLAHATGGERFLPGSPGELMTSCQRIAREIRSGYTIGFVPPDRDGVFHRLKVEVKTADGRRVEVRTRPGYFAAKEPATP